MFDKSNVVRVGEVAINRQSMTFSDWKSCAEFRRVDRVRLLIKVLNANRSIISAAVVVRGLGDIKYSVLLILKRIVVLTEWAT